MKSLSKQKKYFVPIIVTIVIILIVVIIVIGMISGYGKNKANSSIFKNLFLKTEVISENNVDNDDSLKEDTTAVKETEKDKGQNADDPSNSNSQVVKRHDPRLDKLDKTVLINQQSLDKVTSEIRSYLIGLFILGLVLLILLIVLLVEKRSHTVGTGNDSTREEILNVIAKYMNQQGSVLFEKILKFENEVVPHDPSKPSRLVQHIYEMLAAERKYILVSQKEATEENRVALIDEFEEKLQNNLKVAGTPFGAFLRKNMNDMLEILESGRDDGKGEIENILKEILQKLIDQQKLINQLTDSFTQFETKAIGLQSTQRDEPIVSSTKEERASSSDDFDV